jgi:hypothetical protein
MHKKIFAVLLGAVLFADGEALIKLDMPSIVKMGTHPLVPFLAQLQIQRLRPRA